MSPLFHLLRWFVYSRRRTLAAAAAGFTAFINLYAVQSILPLLADVFGTDSQAVSLSISASTLAVALASPFAGWLVSQHSRRKVVITAVAGLVLCGLNVAAAKSLPSMVVWRFLQGLFLPLLIACIMSAIGEDFPKSKVGQVMATYVSWTIVGGFMGRFACGAMAEWCGWREGLYALALLNGLSGLVVIVALPERRKRLLVDSPHGLPQILATFLDPALRTAYLTGFGVLFTLTGLFTYITFHLAREPFNLSPQQLGQLFFVYLLGVFLTPVLGRSLPKVGHRRTTRISALVGVIGLIFTLIPKLEYVVIGLMLVSGAAFATQMAASSFITQVGGEQRALASGLYISFYYLGGCFGAALPGYAWAAAEWPGCIAMLALVQIGLYRNGKNFQRAV